jgi:hypothetical protein
MKTITPTLNEQVVAALQKALDSHLKANGLSAFDDVAQIAAAVNVPWDVPVQEAPAVDPEAALAARAERAK